MKIGIVGVGMVGGTLSYGFRRIGHQVIEHDLRLNTHLRDVLATEVVFICVNTPERLDGSCDTGAVEEVINDLFAYQYTGVVVIKSTVTPGFTDRMMYWRPMEFVFCPEFLREKTAYTDFIDQHDVCIIGAYGDMAYEVVKKAHGNLPKQFVRLTPKEAEFSKYFSNVFNALRIVFANEFYEVCKAAGADYTAIKNAITKRHNIPDYYLECNENTRTFGGHCLPKDTAAFSHYVDSLDILNGSLFHYIVAANRGFEAGTKLKRGEE